MSGSSPSYLFTPSAIMFCMLFALAFSACQPKGPDPVAGEEKRRQHLEVQVEQRLARIDSMLEQLAEAKKKLYKAEEAFERDQSRLPSIIPVPGEIVAGFDPAGRDKVNGVRFAIFGSDSVYITGEGIIVSVEKTPNGRAWTVEADHQNGYRTFYTPLEKLVVDTGDRLSRGDRIGRLRGNMLTYAITEDSVFVDPVDYFYRDLDPERYNNFRNQAQAYNDSPE